MQNQRILPHQRWKGGRSMNTTALKSAGNMPAETEPVTLLKRIGSTTVEVTVHFSKTSIETMADIVRRLIEREVSKIV